MSNDPFNTMRTFTTASGVSGNYHSLPALEKAGIGKISRLPVSIRIVLESVLRNCDGKKITEEHVRQLARTGRRWPRAPTRFLSSLRACCCRTSPAFRCCAISPRCAASRSAWARTRRSSSRWCRSISWSTTPCRSTTTAPSDALDLNMKIEFQRNAERYKFLKWGMQAFDTFKVVPPGIGIVHQVNLEYLARGVHQKDGVYYPDSLVGTDSHTTMINGIGVVAWGVGGIEAEAGHAGPAGLLPDAGCRRRAPEGPAARRRHGDRPGADRHRDAAQVPRSSGSSSNSSARARHRSPSPIARRSATWRPNTARRWASSRSTTRPSTT